MENKTAFHTQSSVAMLPQLDLWAIPPTQVSIGSDIVTEYYPIAPVSEGGPIEFEVKPAIDEYINFAESYLYLRCQTVIDEPKDRATKIIKTDWNAIKPAQNLLHSMINKVDVALGDKVISNAPQSYNYKTYLESLLSFSQEAKKTHMQAQMWVNSEKDRGLKLHPIIGTKTQGTGAAATLVDNDDDYNTNRGREFELMGRLHLDLTFTGKYLIGGCPLKLKLTRADPVFYMKTSDPSKNPRIEIKEAVFIVHKAKALPQLVKAHASAHASGPCIYPITRNEMIYRTVLQGAQDVVLDNVIRGPIPRRMFLFMVPTQAFTGDYTKDPYVFKNHNLNYLVSYIDGTPYPRTPYKPNFAKGLYVKEFLALYQVLNQNLTDTHMSITYDSFPETNCIFAFNFAPDLSDGPGIAGHVNPIEHGNLRIHMRFAEALANALNVCLYFEYDNYIEIHQSRAVTTSYN